MNRRRQAHCCFGAEFALKVCQTADYNAVFQQRQLTAAQSRCSDHEEGSQNECSMAGVLLARLTSNRQQWINARHCSNRVNCRLQVESMKQSCRSVQDHKEAILNNRLVGGPESQPGCSTKTMCRLLQMCVAGRWQNSSHVLPYSHACSNKRGLACHTLL